MTPTSHITRTALAIAIGVLLTAGTAEAAAPHKPAHTEVDFGDLPGTLEVKFADGSGVRLRGGRLVTAAGDRIPALERFDGLRVSRLFSASEDELDAAGREARKKSAREQDDLNLFFRIHTRGAADTAALADALNARDDVELAEPAAKPAPPPATASFVSRQGYRNSAVSSGIDANYAGTVTGGKGENVTVVDVEWGWNRSHEDLSKLRAAGSVVPNGTPCDDEDTDHGTAVVGELAGDPNAFGVTGLVPGARIRTLNASWLDTSGVCRYNPADAVYIAADNTQPGDVILLEQHIPGPRSSSTTGQFGYLPVEAMLSVRSAIQNAVARGRIVIEAAGNGYQNLDDPIYNGWFSTDSGAIMVGAGHSPNCTQYPNDPTAARGRLSYSDYGATVDLQGWGDCVMTAGYGRFTGTGNTAYTATFSGTSSASPIVAAAAASVSSVAKARGGLLTPAQVRNLLRSTGQPQQFGNTGNIGPLPNLRAALPKIGPKLKPASTKINGSALTGATVPVYVSWANSGTPAVSYDVWLSTDGGTFQKLSTTASAATWRLERGHSYQFAARAVDANGIWGEWAYGSTFNVGVFQEDYSTTNPALTGSWTRSPWSYASDGFLSVSSTAGDRASFTFTGTSVAWIGTKATTRGQARVFVDGVLESTVDLYKATTTAKAIAFSRTWTTSATHTITVEVVGTAGRPKVDIDAFARLR